MCRAVLHASKGTVLRRSDAYRIKINWDDRRPKAFYPDTFVSVDATECPISEPSTFDPDLYSHKLNRAGLRYETVIDIHTGTLVSISGPFKCGSHNDLMVFRSSLKSKPGFWRACYHRQSVL